MDWNTVQQILRIVMQWAGAALVAVGVPEDLALAATGGVLSIVGLGWWWWWNKYRPAATPEAVA